MGSVVEDEQKAYAEFREKVRRTVFIDCLSPAATAPVVKAAIGQFGKVLSVRIVPKLPEAAEGGSLPQGALVEMETAARAKAVLQATGDMPFMISGMPRPISPMPATEDMFSDRPRNPDRPRIAARWLDDPADPDLPAAQRLRQLAAKHARERAAGGRGARGGGAARMGKPAWKIVPRPLLETVLNNHAQRHRVHQPLFLHGPRGVGKSSLLLHRLLREWNHGPHLAAYLDFARSDPPLPKPWASWSSSGDPRTLTSVSTDLESALESLVERGVRLGCIGGRDVFSTLNKWHGLRSALCRVIGRRDEKMSISALWSRAVLAVSSKIDGREVDACIGDSLIGNSGNTVEEISYIREAVLSLKLAKEIVRLHQQWRGEAVRHLNRTGRYSMSLARSATDWPCILIELLSNAAEVDHFQPKLIINNIEVLRQAALDDDSTVSAPMYHDSFLWRLIALGVNEKSIPVILITSDSYYSCQAYVDFGYSNVFISRETFGWTPQEAKLHMVPQFFSQSEWKVIDEVIGPNPRHLSELHALMQQSSSLEVTGESGSNFEDLVDAYLAHLQVTVVNSAMESALDILKKFAEDVRNGKVADCRLHFGAPWRHPPRSSDPIKSLRWAKINLMDFVQSLVNAQFGLNYLADSSLEILDDPSAIAMLEVGLLYMQRDPSFVRPVSRGIQRCLVRWLVQEKLKMGFLEKMMFKWHRLIRGRSYRHLLKELGYK